MKKTQAREEKRVDYRGASRITFWEATSIIVGHGVGSGILSVPYLAAHNSVREILLIAALCYAFNLVLHLIIAELSYNNYGAQFIRCMDQELFGGRSGMKKFLTWGAFITLGASVIFNISAFMTGAAAVFRTWLGLPDWVGILLFYVLGSGVVFCGLKLVGFCEKIAVGTMLIVGGILAEAGLLGQLQPLPGGWHGLNNAMALFGMIAFSLSAVMSTPQVVKGLQGEVKSIRRAIATGLAVNVGMILVVAFVTMLCVGSENITQDGALVDMSKYLGGWVSILGYLFTLLALATSFWANALNLRDIIHEQLKADVRLCWLAATLPCFLIAMFFDNTFVGFTRFASIVQVATGVGIVMAYFYSRKRAGQAKVAGWLGKPVLQVTVMLCTLLASLGALMPVK